tara:strand:- start:148 stop:348 length:201 start_codon:yes stop_codon:yes gene_type:complete
MMKMIKRWIVNWLEDDLRWFLMEEVSNQELISGWEVEEKVVELKEEIEEVRTNAQSGFDRIEGSIR